MRIPGYLPEGRVNMSAKQKRLLENILLGHISANISWREIESLLKHLGATIKTGHGATVHVILNGTEFSLHKPHNSNMCTKRDLHMLRDYLVQANIGGDSI